MALDDKIAKVKGTHSYDEIFQRNIGIFTPELQELIKNSCVAIGGCGGVGGAVAEALTRIGIGHLKISDIDHFEPSNCNRQIGATIKTINKEKTKAMEERLKDINPYIKIDVFGGINYQNVTGFLQNTKAIVDAVDYYAPEARLAIHREARKKGKYVFLPPSGGFGTLILCFGPNSPTVEEFLEYPESEEKAKKHIAPIEKLLGEKLHYLPEDYQTALDRKQPSVVGPTVMIAGGVTAIQIVKCFLYREQQKDLTKFSEYGKVKLITLPKALRIDGWGLEYCKVIDFTKKK